MSYNDSTIKARESGWHTMDFRAAEPNYAAGQDIRGDSSTQSPPVLTATNNAADFVGTRYSTANDADRSSKGCKTAEPCLIAVPHCSAAPSTGTQVQDTAESRSPLPESQRAEPALPVNLTQERENEMNYRWTREKLIEHAKSLGFVVKEGVPRPGESYIAGRNTDPKLLTCKTVNENGGWVMSVEPSYSFDFNECVRVELE